MSHTPSPRPSPPRNPGTVLVTGANSGVGFETSRILAGEGHRVVMLCRSEDRGRAAVERIRATTANARLVLVKCDLTSFDDIRTAVRGLAVMAPTPDVLVNNAGVFSSRMRKTDEGFERTMAVNHLGHFLLTRLLEEPLRSAGARIVNVTSKAHESGRLGRRPLEEILRGPPGYRGFGAYGDSKLANVLFTRELARRWGSDVTPLAVHPGLLATRIWDRERSLKMWLLRRLKPLMKDPVVGGRAVATVASDPNFDDAGGAYVNRTTLAEATLPDGVDELARNLWTVSSSAVGLAP